MLATNFDSQNAVWAKYNTSVSLICLRAAGLQLLGWEKSFLFFCKEIKILSDAMIHAWTDLLSSYSSKFLIIT